MRKLFKCITYRVLAAMLSTLLFSLAVAPANAATAAPSARNSARRDLTASSLSIQAQAYYSDEVKDYITSSSVYRTFVDLAEENKNNGSGSSYDATQNNALYDMLYRIMSSTHTHNVTYSGYTSNALATYWLTTDSSVKDTEENSYTFFYSDVPCVGNASMQREHIWPKSKASFYEHGGGSDLHHLRPAYSTVNTVKSNWGFGDLHNSDGSFKDGCTNTRTVEWPTGETALWKGTVGGETFIDVKDDVRGDIARILLYVYTRWQQPNLYSDVAADNLPAFDSDDNQDDGGKIVQSLDTLLDWMEQDPVSEWEMERNDLTENIQGNRNVFIDYPELAWLLFDKEVPTDMDTPSGMAKNTSDNDNDTVTYSFNVKTPEIINGIEGKLDYPATLSVNSIGFDGTANDNNGTILFNASDVSNGFDFKNGNSLITVEFTVSGDYTPSDIRCELFEFYSLDLVEEGNTPFDFENVINDDVVSRGHTDIDIPENSYEETKYSIVYSYRENPKSQTDITYTRSVWSQLSNASAIAEVNMPYIKNPYYDSYIVGSATKNGTTINAALMYRTKTYTVTLNGELQGEYQYLETATVTADSEKDFFIDGNCVARGTAFSFYVTDNIDITTDEPTGEFNDSSTLIANALYVADAGAGKANVKMEMLVTATSKNFGRMGVAFAASPRASDDIKNAIRTVATGTATTNKIAVHNSSVDFPNQSGQFQFIYAPYTSVSKVDKNKSIYFYSYVVDKSGTVTIGEPSQVDFATVLA